MTVMNDKLGTLNPNTRPESLPARRGAGQEVVENAAVFTVKLRVAAPLDHLIAQLYRAWPKLLPRKDT
jgi:hypothetical protein